MPEAQTIISITDSQLYAATKGVNFSELSRAKIDNLRGLCQAKIDAAESFSDACTALAQQATIQPAALASYITAMVKDTLEKTQEKANQLSLLFEELS